MLVFPHFKKIAFSIGAIKIHWYGIMYIVGIAIAWLLALKRAKKLGTWTKNQISDLIFYSAIGLVLGGRIGYVLFYNLPFYSSHIIDIFKIWDGGMSFHGGLLGVVVSLLIFSKKTGKKFFDVTDFLTPLIPLGLGAGRIGNFINGNLWGRVTTMPWGMIYPNAGSLPREPSELFEFFFEGIVLFIILWVFSSKKRPTMATSGLFLLGYGCIRFLLEFLRQPDPQLGFIAFGWLTMGQLLSIPMIIFGIIFLIIAYKKNINKPNLQP